MSDRKEITLEQLAEIKRRKGPNFTLDDIEVSGTAVIRGKDGQIKGTLELYKLEDTEQ